MFEQKRSHKANDKKSEATRFLKWANLLDMIVAYFFQSIRTNIWFSNALIVVLLWCIFSLSPVRVFILVFHCSECDCVCFLRNWSARIKFHLLLLTTVQAVDAICAIAIGSLHKSRNSLNCNFENVSHGHIVILVVNWEAELCLLSLTCFADRIHMTNAKETHTMWIPLLYKITTTAKTC